MSKSTPKAKKSLPAVEITEVVVEAAVPAPVQAPETVKKPTSRVSKKTGAKTVIAPVPLAETELVATKKIAPEAGASIAEEAVALAKGGKQGKTKKDAAPKKAKLIRDSFTFPESDYVLLAILKQRALNAGCEIKKSELLRAGLNALNAMPETELLKVLDGVERIKTGRPSK